MAESVGGENGHEVRADLGGGAGEIGGIRTDV